MVDIRHLVLLMSLASERNAGNGTRNASCIHQTCLEELLRAFVNMMRL